MSAKPPFTPQIRLYQDWLSEHRGLRFDSYDALWRWSTTELDAFWQSIWDYFELQSPTPHQAALVKNAMPGGQWFTGAQANYAQQVFRHADAAHAAGGRGRAAERAGAHRLSAQQRARQRADACGRALGRAGGTRAA